MDKNTIREIREGLGLSQSEFSKKFNIPRRTIENWEQGKSIPKAYIVSLILKVVKLEEQSCQKRKTRKQTSTGR